TLLTPSVKSNAGSTNTGFTDRGTAISSISINGGPNAMNGSLLDGSTNVMSYYGEINIPPAVDAVAEFKVQSGTMSAEFGYTAGGVINLVTRSGTNQFHGSVYSGRIRFSAKGSASRNTTEPSPCRSSGLFPFKKRWARIG